MITVLVSCIGEPWTYYILGSLVEVMLLIAIATTAWRWPPPEIALSLAEADTAQPRLGAAR